MFSKYTLTILLMASIAFLLAHTTAWATPPAGTATQEGKESPMQALMREMQDIRQSHEKNRKDFAALQDKARQVTRLASSDEIIAAAMVLQRQLQEQQQLIDLSRQRHINFKARAESYSATGNPLHQETAFINRYMDELRLFGVQLEKMESDGKQLLQQLENAIKRQPPPATFVNAQGMAMTLIPKHGKLRPFYASTEPLTIQQWNRLAKGAQLPTLEGDDTDHAANITHPQAQSAAKWLSRQSTHPYTLPTAQHCKAIAKARKDFAPPCAFWLAGTPPIDYTEKEAMARFGMTMQPIWDPSRALGKLGDEPFAADLPQAAYNDLGVMLVVDVTAGIEARLQRIAAEIQSQE